MSKESDTNKIKKQDEEYQVSRAGMMDWASIEELIETDKDAAIMSLKWLLRSALERERIQENLKKTAEREVKELKTIIDGCNDRLKRINDRLQEMLS